VCVCVNDYADCEVPEWHALTAGDPVMYRHHTKHHLVAALFPWSQSVQLSLVTDSGIHGVLCGLAYSKSTNQTVTLCYLDTLLDV